MVFRNAAKVENIINDEVDLQFYVRRGGNKAFARPRGVAASRERCWVPRTAVLDVVEPHVTKGGFLQLSKEEEARFNEFNNPLE